MGWEPHDASLATVTCHGVETLDLEEGGQPGQMGQVRWWEVEEAHHRSLGALDVGLLDAGQHAELVGGFPHAARRD